MSKTYTVIRDAIYPRVLVTEPGRPSRWLYRRSDVPVLHPMDGVDGAPSPHWGSALSVARDVLIDVCDDEEIAARLAVQYARRFCPVMGESIFQLESDDVERFILTQVYHLVTDLLSREER